jgi:hypothetical protein
LLAGYESGETVTAGTHNKDAELAVSVVSAASVGLTATQGDNILALTFTNCTDGKVEFDHTWTSGSFSTIGQTQIVFDLYIPTGTVDSFTVIGYWDHNLGWSGNWAPTVVQGAWQTITLNVLDPLVQLSDQIEIHALVLEGMQPRPVNATFYIDNLRTIPEPVTMALLGLGSLFLARRRK